MRRLAEEVGLGAAALYRYFPTKQAMLFDLLKGHMDDMLAAWRHVRPSASMPPNRRLTAFTRFHINHHHERADSLFLSYMELRSLSQENFSVIEDLRRDYEREISSIIEDGLSDGSFESQDPRVTARAILAMLNGLPVWYREGGALSRPAVESLYLNMVAGLARATTDEEIVCSMPA